MEKYVKAKEAAEFYKTSVSNVRRMAREGMIPAKRTEGGHFIYLLKTAAEENTLKKIVYSRVSSKKQTEDLERQTQYLHEKYPEYEIISDVGSGINFSRKGFRSILNYLFQGQIQEVVVAHKDRFSRFGFEFFQWIFEYFGAKLISDSDEDDREDFLGDVMEIFTVFTARYYGKRKYLRKMDKMGK